MDVVEKELSFGKCVNSLLGTVPERKDDDHIFVYEYRSCQFLIRYRTSLGLLVLAAVAGAVMGRTHRCQFLIRYRTRRAPRKPRRKSPKSVNSLLGTVPEKHYEVRKSGCVTRCVSIPY